MWKAENKSGGYRGPSGPSQNQMGLRRDPNTMDMDKGKGGNCKEAKLQAGMKPTALCSAIDKKNSIESPLDSATLYIQLLLWLCTLPPTVLMPVS